MINGLWSRPGGRGRLAVVNAAEVQQDGGHETGPEDLLGALAQLARDLQRVVGTRDTLQKTVAAAIAMIPGAEDGSISVVNAREQIESWAASGDLPRTVDEVQGEVGQGPCLDAAFEAEVVEVPDMAAEERWPGFARRASEAGVGSMLCLRLYVSGDDLGALNLYNRVPHAFTEESKYTGMPFAAHAAVALAQVQQRQHLLTAIDSRDVIGQAKGILMERHKLSSEQAFHLLTTASQHRNVKLRTIAEELVFSGQLKGPHGTA